jgi:hypothetical protein
MAAESSRTVISLPLLREPWRSHRTGSMCHLRASAEKMFTKVNAIWAPEALP